MVPNRACSEGKLASASLLEGTRSKQHLEPPFRESKERKIE